MKPRSAGFELYFEDLESARPPGRAGPPASAAIRSIGQITAYIRKGTHQGVKIRLLPEG